MIILPAIDIKDGECVRLIRGDYSTADKVADDAVDTAASFEKKGAKWLHVVDLNGAKAARPVNADLLMKVRRNTGLHIEIGGGIRNMDTIDYYLSRGIDRVIMGTAAISKPELVVAAVEKYGDRIMVGIDALDGNVAQKGWMETVSINYLKMADHMEQAGVKYIIFTDIFRDGTLAGPNLEMLDKLNRTVSCNIIASGGIRDLKDIQSLIDLNVYGAICGKSLYAGTLELSAAVKLCEESEKEKSDVSQCKDG